MNATDAGKAEAINQPKLSDPMDFNLDRIEVPVRLTRPDRSGVDLFILRELDGAQRDAYLNGVLRDRTQFNKEGEVVGTKDYNGIMGLVLSIGMYPAKDTGEKTADGGPIFQATSDNPVTLAFAQSLPAQIQKSLANRLKEISGLGEAAAGQDGAAKKP